MPEKCKTCSKPPGPGVIFRLYITGTYANSCNRCNRSKQKKPENPVKPLLCVKCGQSEGTDVSFIFKPTLGYYNKTCNQCLRYYNYIYGAKERSLSWDAVTMTREYCVSLMLSLCHYCNQRDGLNGIDRFDNEQGYTKKNCVPCCAKCNIMKGTIHGLEYIDHCGKIYQHVLSMLHATHSEPANRESSNSPY